MDQNQNFNYLIFYYFRHGHWSKLKSITKTYAGWVFKDEEGYSWFVKMSRYYKRPFFIDNNLNNYIQSFKNGDQILYEKDLQLKIDIIDLTQWK